MRPPRKEGEGETGGSHSRERLGKLCTTMPISLGDLIRSNRKELVTKCNPNSFYELMREALCAEPKTAHEKTEGKYAMTSLLLKSCF